MVDYYKSYDLQVDQRKAEMRLHYSTTGNFRERARTFNLNESTVRGIIKTHPVAGRMILSKKQNFPGELSCRIRRPAYKMDPCFTGFEFSSVYFSPSGESKESHKTWQPRI